MTNAQAFEHFAFTGKEPLYNQTMPNLETDANCQVKEIGESLERVRTAMERASELDKGEPLLVKDVLRELSFAFFALRKVEENLTGLSAGPVTVNYDSRPDMKNYAAVEPEPDREPSYNCSMTDTTTLEQFEFMDKHGRYDEDKKHGAPFDRGSADAWYGRGPEPHFYPDGSYNGERIEEDKMTINQREAYWAGYTIHEADPGYRKQYD